MLHGFAFPIVEMTGRWISWQAVKQDVTGVVEIIEILLTEPGCRSRTSSHFLPVPHEALCWGAINDAGRCRIVVTFD
ncbi:hypothetical protein D3C84_473010 [compost metagenome]